jgi:hypothetical protein
MGRRRMAPLESGQVAPDSGVVLLEIRNDPRILHRCQPPKRRAINLRYHGRDYPLTRANHENHNTGPRQAFKQQVQGPSTTAHRGRTAYGPDAGNGSPCPLCAQAGQSCRRGKSHRTKSPRRPS